MNKLISIGAKVKNHNGVDIYITTNGLFYCDPKSNSNNYYDKLFESEKLQSIESAIDSFVNNINDGKSYYYIGSYNATVNKIKIVSNVGSLILFDDGSSTKDNNRKLLFEENIENTVEFESISNLCEEYKDISLKIKQMYSRQSQIIKEIEKKKSVFRLVKPQP